MMGVLGVILMVASSGATFLLNDTGKNLRCSDGWSFIESGEFEGQYSCSSSSGVRYSYCASVRDTAAGRVGYWCDEAVPVYIEPDPGPIKTLGRGSGSYNCFVDGCKT